MLRGTLARIVVPGTLHKIGDSALRAALQNCCFPYTANTANTLVWEGGGGPSIYIEYIFDLFIYLTIYFNICLSVHSFNLAPPQSQASKHWRAPTA